MPRKKKLSSLQALCSQALAGAVLSLIKILKEGSTASWKPGLDVIRRFIIDSVPVVLLEELSEMYLRKIRKELEETRLEALRELTHREPIPLDILYARNQLAESVIVLLSPYLKKLDLNRFLLLFPNDWGNEVPDRWMIEVHKRVFAMICSMKSLSHFRLHEAVCFSDCSDDIPVATHLSSCLSGCTELRSLHLTNFQSCNLSGFLKSMCPRWHELREVNLEGSAVTDADALSLAECKNITSLRLNGTKVSESCAAQLLISLECLQRFGWEVMNEQPPGTSFCKLLGIVVKSKDSPLSLKCVMGTEFSTQLMSGWRAEASSLVVSMCPSLCEVSVEANRTDDNSVCEFLNNFELSNMSIKNCVLTTRIESYLKSRGSHLVELQLKHVNIQFNSIVCLIKQCSSLEILYLEVDVLFADPGDSIIPYSITTKISYLSLLGGFSPDVVKLLLVSSPLVRFVLVTFHPTTNPVFDFGDDDMHTIVSHNPLSLLQNFAFAAPNTMTMVSINSLIEQAPDLRNLGYLNYWKGVTCQDRSHFMLRKFNEGWDMTIK